MKSNLVALSICFLGICIVIGSWIIPNALSIQPTVETKHSVQHQLLTQSELVNYLGLSKEEIQQLTELSDGGDVYTSELPHIKIGSKFYYPKSAIDKWLLNVELTTIP
ncbi:helix-turn-helix domain-containing protein [Bacillus sp. OAE603]|uniref:helix-turn-helix domain-containing protein n=1 Tax=Gottfriedia sp. OAE603 TaxID=2663872 RepID=UPI001788FD81